MQACATYELAPNEEFEPTMAQVPESQPVKNGSLFNQQTSVRLFEDRRARRQGDILTVNLVERMDASKNASTSTSKSSSATLNNPIILGNPVTRGGLNLSGEISGDREFDGEGDSSQSNSISGSITVFVSKVLPNGYLLVKGQKRLSINHGDEYVRFSGIVRPIDISASNSVASTQVADAKITYGGNGPIAKSNIQGWLSRFFASPLWPF